jgi:hypothetical protein
MDAKNRLTFKTVASPRRARRKKRIFDSNKIGHTSSDRETPKQSWQ